MRTSNRRKGFTIIELLIVVIVIGVLASAGLAKYQNFAEASRRKACLSQLKQIETAVSVWETTNTAFAENAKCAFGFTPRTGRLTNTALAPTGAAILAADTSGTISAIADSQLTVGGPPAFLNVPGSGPLGAVMRDDNVWTCPSAVGRFYGGEIQNVPDDYLDTMGAGVSPPAHAGSAIGLGGRYLYVVTGTITGNGGFPNGWISDGSVAAAATAAVPSPQRPFKIAICGSYGTYGTGTAGSNILGTSAVNQGGPVGPDGSSINRHSTRW